jgi:hypothetical protein
MHGSSSKIPTKNLFGQSCAERFNSGVKGLKLNPLKSNKHIEIQTENTFFKTGLEKV